MSNEIDLSSSNILARKDNVETGGILASNEKADVKPVLFEPAPAGTDNSGNFVTEGSNGSSWSA